MVTITKMSYTILGGWSTENISSVSTEEAAKIAAKYQKGNSNLGVTPEKWSENKIKENIDFVIFPDQNNKVEFRFV